MQPVTPTATARRLLRAEAARTLLELHAAQSLAEPERWTWEVLDRLPTWCLFDSERRERLQRVAGALLMGPELRLWIDRARLLEAERLLGTQVLDGVLCRADAMASALGKGGNHDDIESHSPSEDDTTSLDARFMAAGAAVLVATLHDSLPLGALADSLGPQAGALPEATARHLLHQAEHLIVDSSAPQTAAAA